MSLEQSQGIQALLAAEKASAETINNARKSMFNAHFYGGY
jgi:hypothetical protein